MQSPPPFALAAYLASSIDVLCKVVAARGGRCKNQLPGPLIVWIWNRLRRISANLTALAARIEAGTYRPRQTSPRPSPSPALPMPRPQRPTRPAPMVPLRSMWLIRVIQETAFGGSHLRYAFAQPGVAELLAENRQMRRLLRPLCTMFGVPLPPLRTAPPEPPPDPPPAQPLDGTEDSAAPSKPTPPPPPPLEAWRILPPPKPTPRPSGCGPPVPA